jgi:glycerol kinase
VEQQYNGCEMAQNDKYSCRNRNFGSKRTRQWRRLFVPALTGLGATLGPIQAQFWDYKRNDKRSYSTCDPEGIAYQVYDLAKSMEADLEKRKELKVDGGAA